MDGTEVLVVEAGHKIINPKTGEEHIVTDNCFVTHGNKLWVTKTTYEAIRHLSDAKVKEF